MQYLITRTAFGNMTPQLRTVLLLTSVASSHGLPVSETGRCPKLSDTDRKVLQTKLHADMFTNLHWTYWLIPYLQQAWTDAMEPMEKALQDRSTYLYGPKRCSRLKHVDKEYDCPAQYVMHHDVNRIPENIVYAKCVCERCRHANANHSKQCQPMYTLTRVLRRNSACVYDWTYDRVPVACTCKFGPQIVHVGDVKAEDVPFVPQAM